MKMKGRRGEEMVLGNGEGKWMRENIGGYSHIGHREMEGKRKAVCCWSRHAY